MQKLAIIAGLVAWSLLVFSMTLSLTFPSGKMADFVSYQVSEMSNDAWSLQADSASPSILGLSFQAPVLANSARKGGEKSPILALDRAKVSAGLFDIIGLMTGGSGVVDISMRQGDGHLDLSVGVDCTDSPNCIPNALTVQGTIGVGDLPPISGASLEGHGSIEIDGDLNWADGFSNTSGVFKVNSKDVRVTGLGGEGDIGQMMEGFDGWPLPIEKINILVDFGEGKGTIKRGRINCDWFEFDLDGEIVLADEFGRSRLKSKLVVEPQDAFDELELATFVKQAQKSALHGDGKYHYNWTGMLSRLKAPRAERESTRNKRSKRPNQGRAGNSAEKSSKSGRPTPKARKTTPRSSGSANRSKDLNRQIEPLEIEEEPIEDIEAEDEDLDLELEEGDEEFEEYED